MNDIVYFLRDGVNEELRYSLRSVEHNFPHNRVIFYGGKPDGITPDMHVAVNQYQPSKWERVRAMMLDACRNDDITPDFWMFNDDFFVMKPISNPCNYYDGTLKQRIDGIPADSAYRWQLARLHHLLEKIGITEPLNYAHHTPMLVNRAKMVETLEKYPDMPMFRALYGNINHIGGQEMPDVKFYLERQPWPLGTFASTADESWKREKIGRIIRDAFTTPSRWEDG